MKRFILYSRKLREYYSYLPKYEIRLQLKELYKIHERD